MVSLFVTHHNPMQRVSLWALSAMEQNFICFVHHCLPGSQQSRVLISEMRTLRDRGTRWNRRVDTRWKVVHRGLHPHTLPACQLLGIWGHWNPLDLLGPILAKQNQQPPELEWIRLLSKVTCFSRSWLNKTVCPRQWSSTAAVPWVTLKQSKKVAGCTRG